MFGILRPCADHSCAAVLSAWRAHLCGLCLTLRDRHGQVARAATNYDGLVLSVLTEAQADRPPAHRTAGPCALRGFRSADVIASRDQGSRLAAVASLALAAGKIRDHAVDGDGPAGRRFAGAPLRRVATSWTAAAERDAASIGFDTRVLTAAAERQAVLEATGGLPLPRLTEPTEEAAAAAFAHTAILASTPHNAENLREAGRLFGRIAHLLDAVEDLEDDRARGRYNPLTATGTSLAETRRLCDDAVHGLGLAVRGLDLRERHLVEALLAGETRRAVDRAFAVRHTRPGPVRSAGAGLLTFVTCGLYRPPWSSHRDEPWTDRCRLGGDCCDCSACCDCCPCDCDCDCDCSP
ncbi:hypothetical protein Pth03_58070 [Planotetraspora thailandica]|uniref:Regulatory protein n=1 Tax=Planotetraspora thailandica TaxID=487172 RepID=A0A8J3V4U3_9ACTN|nr:DUF5685 family protein [Planotetraspora thailandica]GII57418.1 hypothetical protein Pth03_58070 [Planotetraspora thailandica]